MAQSRKLGVQLRRVVQLAVVHQNVFLPALIQHHGLAAVFQIHHSQPRMDQRRMAVQVYSPLVRPAACKAFLHSAVSWVVGCNLIWVRADLSGNSTHRYPLPYIIRVIVCCGFVIYACFTQKYTRTAGQTAVRVQMILIYKNHGINPGSRAAFCCGWGGAASAGPWPRSGGCAPG